MATPRPRGRLDGQGSFNANQIDPAGLPFWDSDVRSFIPE